MFRTRPTTGRRRAEEVSGGLETKRGPIKQQRVLPLLRGQYLDSIFVERPNAPAPPKYQVSGWSLDHVGSALTESDLIPLSGSLSTLQEQLAKWTENLPTPDQLGLVEGSSGKPNGNLTGLNANDGRTVTFAVKIALEVRPRS